ncbi:MAG TPA: hypothetical protein VF532_22305 [Candidatus Angelobacter sp.]
MKTISLVTGLCLVLVFAVAAQVHSSHEQHASGNTAMHPSHTPGAPVSFAELKNTVALLERARQATAKYQDVHVAEADGYQVVGPDMPGMGVHFVLSLEPKSFDIEKPPILLYAKTTSGYTLAGVSYLWNAAEGPDGQPLDPPFPKSLARWHRHDNICVLPHLENPHGLTETQCRDQGGRFIAKTQWLVHAWIWKDNPTGVFSAENPALQ